MTEISDSEAMKITELTAQVLQSLIAAKPSSISMVEPHAKAVGDALTSVFLAAASAEQGGESEPPEVLVG